MSLVKFFKDFFSQSNNKQRKVAAKELYKYGSIDETSPLELEQYVDEIDKLDHEPLPPHGLYYTNPTFWEERDFEYGFGKSIRYGGVCYNDYDFRTISSIKDFDYNYDIKSQFNRTQIFAKSPECDSSVESCPPYDCCVGAYLDVMSKYPIRFCIVKLNGHLLNNNDMKKKFKDFYKDKIVKRKGNVVTIEVDPDKKDMFKHDKGEKICSFKKYEEVIRNENRANTCETPADFMREDIHEADFKAYERYRKKLAEGEYFF